MAQAVGNLESIHIRGLTPESARHGGLTPAS